MKSFEINHDKLWPGIYKHSVSGLVTTWDVRVKVPNKGVYLSPAVIHSLEHTLATFMRKKYGNYRIVGIFPMGCQTGFYILTRFVDCKMIYDSILEYIDYLLSLDKVPGATKKQCGNYRLQDLEGAKMEMLEYRNRFLSLGGFAYNGYVN